MRYRCGLLLLLSEAVHAITYGFQGKQQLIEIGVGCHSRNLRTKHVQATLKERMHGQELH